MTHSIHGNKRWLALIVPILVAIPGFFSGSLTLGGLMVLAGRLGRKSGQGFYTY